jgi:hypothetical protein
MIDAKELEEALDVFEQMPRNEYEDLILSAARAHLATLPRWKDVEVKRWAFFNSTGQSGTMLYDNEGQARTACPYGWSVVKLTGTAMVEV